MECLSPSTAQSTVCNGGKLDTTEMSNRKGRFNAASDIHMHVALCMKFVFFFFFSDCRNL